MIEVIDINNYKVYMHKNKINNKIYIGITCQNVNARWRNGEGYKDRKNSKKNTHFYNAISKYGWDNFTHEVLFDNLNKEEACLLEQCYIALYDTTNPECGYNCTTGGESFNHTDDTKKALSNLYKGENNPFYGKHHTEDAKKNISEKIKGEKHPMYGKHHTEDTKKKISEANKFKHCGEKHPMYGKHHIEETKKKISNTLKGKMAGEKNPMYGKKGILSPNYGKTFSEEHRRKIGESKKGKNNLNSKSVYVIELDMTFDTITECAKYLNCTKANISNVLRGKSKTAKGYHIIYAENK